MAVGEALTLDGLALNADAGPFRLLSFNAPPPKQRVEWVTSADSEGAGLMRDPRHENREITLEILVDPQADIAAALDKINQVVDKLAAASLTPDGIELHWTPASTIRAAIFDVLSGEIEELPITYESGYFAKRPTFTVKLTCKPYYRQAEVTVTAASGTLPSLTFTIPDVPGDVPALGRLVVTDLATQNRRFVEWGLDPINSSSTVIIDSDSMVTSGFAGALATVTGAYDPNATGNNVISATLLGIPVAVCGTGDQTHIGTWRVRGRVRLGALASGNDAHALDTRVRLTWRDGDGPWHSNDWQLFPIGKDETFVEMDLGVITVGKAKLGAQRWTGRVDVYNTLSGGTFAVDYLKLIPAVGGYGKATTPTPSGFMEIVNGLDQFTGTTAGGNLNARVAPTGGTWATAGVATDFQFADNPGEEYVTRTTVSEALGLGRTAILGATNYTNIEVAVSTYLSASTSSQDRGVIARWTDASNLVRLACDFYNGQCELITHVAGVQATIAASPVGGVYDPAPVGWYVLRLVVYASGKAIGHLIPGRSITGPPIVTVTGTSTALATGGTLATGKPGFFDNNPTTNAATRYYDEFYAGTPPTEQITLASGQSLEIRHDDVIREDSGGTMYGRPGSYRGTRFLLPPEGTDGTTTRMVVHAHRNNIDVDEHTPLGDNLQAQVFYTPRGIAVPR